MKNDVDFHQSLSSSEFDASRRRSEIFYGKQTAAKRESGKNIFLETKWSSSYACFKIQTRCLPTIISAFPRHFHQFVWRLVQSRRRYPFSTLYVSIDCFKLRGFTPFKPLEIWHGLLFCCQHM